MQNVRGLGRDAQRERQSLFNVNVQLVGTIARAHLLRFGRKTNRWLLEREQRPGFTLEIDSMKTGERNVRAMQFELPAEHGTPGREHGGRKMRDSEPGDGGQDGLPVPVMFGPRHIRRARTRLTLRLNHMLLPSAGGQFLVLVQARSSPGTIYGTATGRVL
uniref:Uncharacterized protein n=1 Tax=Cacopsylla melanoneura TaxID=428564 RepID=A0A8D8UHK3_9HEMI